MHCIVLLKRKKKKQASMHHFIVMKCTNSINMLRYKGEEPSIIKVSDIKNTSYHQTSLNFGV